MSYTDDQIDQKLKSKADTDCVYNVCEMNQILANKAGIDSIELIKKNIQSNNDDLNKNIAQEAIERKEADGNLQNEISAIDVRVEFIENQNGVGQKVITSVSKYSDLSSLDTYDGKTVYVENIGLYTYNDSTKKWIQDNNFDLTPKKFSTNFVNNNGGYKKSARLILNDGITTVISTVDNNNVDPNNDMTGWVTLENAEIKNSVIGVNSFDDLLKINSPRDYAKVYVKDIGIYTYDPTLKNWLLNRNFLKIKQGTNFLADSNNKNELDVLVENSTTTTTVDISNQNIIIPNGNFSAKQWFYNRDIGQNIPNYNNFNISGNSDITTEIKSISTGRHIWVDYLKRANFSDMHLNNMELGIGTDNNRKEGQIHARYLEDSSFNNIRLTGGDLMSFCLSGGSNNFSNNIKVDFQFRYPVGYSKSPILIGDYTEHAIITNSYVRAVHPDGSALYDGDLADNDQANDSKWAFINLKGIPYEKQANASACQWQEGENDRSNAHFFGMNYLAHGVGHGISELSLGTDIGCTVRDSQMRGVWNRSKYFSIGSHFLNIKSPNIGGSNPNIGSAIHIDNGSITVSLGNYFEGNKNDISDYSSTPNSIPESAFHGIGDRYSSNIILGTDAKLKHFGLTSSTLSDDAKFISFCDGHISLSNTHVVGSIGNIGANTKGNRTDIVSSTFTANNTEVALIVKGWYQYVYFKQCKISDYKNGIVSLTDTGIAGTVVFTDCLFNNVIFLDSDLNNAVFINCQFNDCTNSPEFKGLNFKCDSHDLPSSVATVKQMLAGETYTFPQWSHSLAGMYDVNVSGGNGDEQAFYKCTIAKKFRGYDATKYNEVAFDTNAITVTYSGNSQIKVTVRDSGTYRLKLG